MLISPKATVKACRLPDATEANAVACEDLEGNGEV